MSIDYLVLCNGFVDGKGYLRSINPSDKNARKKVQKFVAAYLNMYKINVLNFSNLHLQSLPRGIGLFKDVSWLDLSNNDILFLPDNLLDLFPNLVHLTIKNNPKIKISENLRSKLKNLQSFWE
jgi:Leucine-rich repeat (LRR) protein